MLPNNNTAELDEKVNGTKAYRIDFENKTIGEVIDGREALMQAIRIALMTERYKYAVFSRNYGVELKKCMDMDYTKAMCAVKNVICDALIYDDRIKSIDSFTFEKKGCRMIVNYRVVSVYGNIYEQTEVAL